MKHQPVQASREKLSAKPILVIIGRLLLAILLWRGGLFLLRWGLTSAFGRLFAAWNIDAANVHLAPKWAQAVYVWHGSAITVITGLATLPLCLGLRKILPGQSRAVPSKTSLRAFTFGTGLGWVIPVTGMLLFLLLDSIRPEWPLSQPRLSYRLIPLMIVSLISVLAEESINKTVFYEFLRPKGMLRGIALACLLFLFSNGGLGNGVLCAVNMAFMGALSCLLFEKWGLWAAVGFRWGWSAIAGFLLGFAGKEYSLYAFYSVSETWLTGKSIESIGIIAGLWTTLALAGVLLLWLRREGLLRGVIIKHKH